METQTHCFGKTLGYLRRCSRLTVGIANSSWGLHPPREWRRGGAAGASDPESSDGDSTVAPWMEWRRCPGHYNLALLEAPYSILFLQLGTRTGQWFTGKCFSWEIYMTARLGGKGF